MPARNGAGPEAPCGGHNTQSAPPPLPLPDDAPEPADPPRPGPPDPTPDPPPATDAGPVFAAPTVAIVEAVVEEVAADDRDGNATAPPAAG